MQISQIFPTCTVEITLHALKGQKLLAQGSALGFCLCESSTPCKGKSFTYRRGFSFFIRCILKLLPLQGALLIALYPGRCPGLGASALSGRAAVGFLVFWAFCCGLLDLQGVLLGLLGLLGVLLGLLGLLGVAAVGFLAFWVCCWVFLAFWACCCGLLDLLVVLLWDFWAFACT